MQEIIETGLLTVVAVLAVVLLGMGQKGQQRYDKKNRRKC